MSSARQAVRGAAGLELRSFRSIRLRGLGVVPPLADQLLISGSNVATTVVIGRAIGVAGLGVFSLAYIVVYLGTSLQTALVTQPHNVLGTARGGEDYGLYTTGAFAMQICVASVLACVVTGVGVSLLAFEGRSALTLCLALAVALFAAQIQEFFRRVHYTNGQVSRAFVGDVLSYGGQVGLLIGAELVWNLSPARALLLIAGTSVASALWLKRSVQLGRLSRDAARHAVGVNLPFGKWLAAAAGAYWLATQGCVYLLALVEGVKAAGTLRAAFVVVGPINVAMLAIGTALPVRLARIHNSTGIAEVSREQAALLRVALPVAATGLAALAVFARPAIALLFGGRFEGAVGATRILCVFCLLAICAQIYAAGLRAARDSYGVFLTYVAGLTATGVSCVVLVPLMAANGVAVAIAIGAGTSALAARGLLLRAVRREAGGNTAVSPRIEGTLTQGSA